MPSTVPKYGPLPKRASQPYDEALDWALALMRQLDAMERAEIDAEWNSPAGQKHRATLREHLLETLGQVVDHIQDRLKQLPKAA